MRRLHCLLVAGIAAAAGLAAAGPAAAQLHSFRVTAGFNQPLYATSAPGDPDRLFVVERGGLIRILNVNTGVIEATPFLNMADVAGAGLITAGGEQGLLGLAFHPDYQTNGQFYINYVSNNGNGGDPNGFTRVDRFTRQNANQADASSRQAVLSFQQPQSNHNGGWMGFSPRDNFLYIASGDGGGGNDPSNFAQNRASLLGKMLRVDVNSDAFADPNQNYAIPGTNPFAGNGSGFREEIWSYGLRNPWRSSFDRTTHDLWIADVGQGAWEEVDFQAAASAGGENYGWRVFEGTHDNPANGDSPPNPRVDPIFEYDHGVGSSITGGYVYRGGVWQDDGAALDGAYFFADFISSRIWSFRYDGASLTDFQERTGELRNAINGGSIFGISSFGEDGRGNLYIVDYSGEIFQIRSFATVPEPGTLLLVGGAGAGFAFWRRRRGKAETAPCE